MPVGSAGGSSGDRIVKATVAELNNGFDSVGFPLSLRGEGGSRLMAHVAKKALL